MKQDVPIRRRLFAAFFQLLGTAFIIAFVQIDILKPILLLVWWYISFWKITKQELILFLVCAAILPIVNILAVSNGHFIFAEQNILKMPFYEYTMWGFYFLFAKRMLEVTPPKTIPKICWFFVILFMVLFFGAGKNYEVMTITTSLVILAAFLYFRTWQDFICVVFFSALGLLVESYGVLVGQWSYPIKTFTILGAPLWLTPFWAGMGFIFFRIIGPLLLRKNEKYD